MYDGSTIDEYFFAFEFGKIKVDVCTRHLTKLSNETLSYVSVLVMTTIDFFLRGEGDRLNRFNQLNIMFV
jgi:hypothetical protein